MMQLIKISLVILWARSLVVIDTHIILPSDAPQLERLKEILQFFASLTGLKVNFNKSFIIPINVSDEKMNQLACTLNC